MALHQLAGGGAGTGGGEEEMPGGGVGTGEGPGEEMPGGGALCTAVHQETHCIWRPGCCWG